MPKVLYDCQAFDMQKRGGVSRYFHDVIKAISSSKDWSCELPCLASRNQYLEASGLAGLGLPRFLKKRLEKYNQANVFRRLRAGNYDVFHPTYYDPSFLKFSTKPFVLTVYDMIHERAPQYYSPGDRTIGQKAALMKRAARIIAISKSTKDEILHFYPGIPDHKVTVVLLGHQPLPENGSLPACAPKNYILYVGSRLGYKNFTGMLAAFAQIARARGDVSLFCAGGGKWSRRELDLVDLHGLGGRVFQADVPDAGLHQLYKHAIFFIYPSLHEGFGLPILEAFQAGCPVLLSDTSPFREVAGDSAVFFDPTDEQNVKAAMCDVLETDGKREELRLSGLRRLALFSHQKCVEETLAVYKDACSACAPA